MYNNTKYWSLNWNVCICSASSYRNIFVISPRRQLFNAKTINNSSHCLVLIVVCFHLSGINTFAPISFWKHKQSCWALQFHFAMRQKLLWMVLVGSQWAQSSSSSVSTSSRWVPVSSRMPLGVGGQKEFSNLSPLYQLCIKINVRVRLCLHMKAIKFQITVNERVQNKEMNDSEDFKVTIPRLTIWFEFCFSTKLWIDTADSNILFLLDLYLNFFVPYFYSL